MPRLKTVRLMEWLDDPSSVAGVHILTDDHWALHSYVELTDRINGVAAQLVEAGLQPDDILAVCESDAVSFITTYFGALRAGATPMPLPSFEAFGRSASVRIGAILDRLGPRLLATHNRTVIEEIGAGHSTAPNARLVELSVEKATSFSPRPVADVVTIQLTSGSTGSPRGVPLTLMNLENNLSMLLDVFGVDQDDGAVSWLPLHHDMGLVGMMLPAVVTQRRLWQMRPRQFLFTPLRWLDCLGRLGATVTAAPNFGYAYICRRVRPSQLEGLDFSNWRAAYVGAERIVPQVLADFSAKLANNGFRREAFRPGYGLAEATYGVTAASPSKPAQCVGISWDSLRFGSKVEVRVGPHPFSEGETPRQGELVSSGRPLRGVGLRIVDHAGGDLSPGVLGEVVVEGHSVAAGYLGHDGGLVTRFVDGRLFTGDAGFLLDDQLYVIGRLGDSVKSRGRHVFVETLEARIAEDVDIPLGRCAVLASQKAGKDCVLAILEGSAGRHATAVLDCLRVGVGPDIDVAVRVVPAHTILRTTSGKPRRREMWSRIMARDLLPEWRGSASPRSGSGHRSQRPE